MHADSHISRNSPSAEDVSELANLVASLSEKVAEQERLLQHEIQRREKLERDLVSALNAIIKVGRVSSGMFDYFGRDSEFSFQSNISVFDNQDVRDKILELQQIILQRSGEAV